MGLDRPTPLLKQLPFTGLFSVAIVLSAVIPTLSVTNASALVTSVAFTAIATVLAVVLSRDPNLFKYGYIVPILDLQACGSLRFATGESRSIFASLVILPVIWFAASEGRRFIAYSFLGVCNALLVPFILGTSISENPNELWRGLFSALAFTFAAAVVNELSRLSRRKLSIVERREQATTTELDQASRVQRALLPKSGTPLPSYQVAGACIPSTAIGGDFFDWYPIRGGLGFTLGDVMGKGVGAGIIAATARAVVRSARNDEDPVVAFTRTADCLATDLGDTESFATLFHARIRAEDGRMLYADAGHGLTVVARVDGSWERLGSTDLPLGLGLEDDWTMQELFLHPGDMVVCFSDGVLDLYDGSMAAVDHVADIAVAASSASEVVDAISSLAALTNNPDDVTVVALARLAPA
jgi:serine phosphatase RsbU (regulator of sigma subunit)